MIILALDLATTTGVAVGDARDGPKMFTEKLGSAGDPEPVKFDLAMRMTTALIQIHKPEWVVLEQPIAHGPAGSATRVMHAAGIRACVMGVSRRYGVPVGEYAVSTIRKHFIGETKLKRKAAKAAVIARCNRLGWAVENDNEADAAALWDLARAKRGFEPAPIGLFEQGPKGEQSLP